MQTSDSFPFFGLRHLWSGRLSVRFTSGHLSKSCAVAFISDC